MLKHLLIASILVHLALLIEVVPEQTELLTNNVDEPKKYHNHEHRESKEYYDKTRGEKKHKKYYSEENKKQGKFHVDKNNELELNQLHKERKTYFEDNEAKAYKNKPRHHEEKRYNHDGKKKYGVSERLIVANIQEQATHPVDLSSDTDVNNKLMGKAVNPNSEIIPNAFIKKDFYAEMKKLDLTKVPDANDTILMARFIVHNVDWAALATVTARNGVKHSPYANIISMSDGPVDQGSGVPFFYMTPKDLSSKDLAKENKASITVTLAQTPYCRQEGLDPEDPRCARVTLSGKIKPVKAGTMEDEFGQKALFTRHPVMKTWPQDHGFYISKLKIGQIVLLDQFGGPKNIDVEEYLNAEDHVHG